MTQMFRWCAIGLVLLAGSGVPVRAQLPLDSLTKLARDAYIVAFPVLETYRRVYQTVAGPNAPGFNVFRHTLRLADPTFRSIPRPNNDTFYSVAWLDLRTSGAVLTLPAAPANRYRSAQVADQFTHNVAIISQPSNVDKRYLVVGPRWTGNAPPDVAAVVRVETPFAAVITRTGVLGSADSAAAVAIQTSFRIDPVGAPGTAGDLLPFAESQMSSADFVEPFNFVLHNSRVHPADEALLRSFAPVGIRTNDGAGMHPPTPEERRAIDRGVSEARDRIRASAPRLSERRGTWTLVDAFGNRERMQGRHLVRAVAAMYGLFGLDREEAVYMGSSRDRNNEVLNGGQARYTLRFAADSLPPARSFWSITVYDSAGFLVPNPIGRYSIGDRTPGLVRDRDGGLTIHLQAEQPDPASRTNWLPVPSGPFSLTLRLYWPDPSRVSSYVPPAVEASP